MILKSKVIVALIRAHRSDLANFIVRASRLEEYMPADKAEQYMWMAIDADRQQWAEWMARYNVPPDVAEQVRLSAIKEERDKTRRKAKKQQRLAMRSDMAGKDFRVKPKELKGVVIDDDLDEVASMLGGIAEILPPVAAVIKRFVKKIRSGGGGAAASYRSPSTLLIGNPRIVTPRILVHEMGHAADALLPSNWALSGGWGPEDPHASEYALLNPSEAFAEAWTEMLIGDAKKFERWAPHQADAVKTVLRKLGRAKVT